MRQHPCRIRSHTQLWRRDYIFEKRIKHLLTTRRGDCGYGGIDICRLRSADVNAAIAAVSS
ncbi:MAG: hypothetical protein ACI35N_02830, partial [Marinilabiliaceae bacterium]